MGNARHLRYACPLTALVLLTGCDSAPRMWSRDEVRQIARESQPPNNSILLEAAMRRLDQAETDNRMLTARLTDLERAHDSLLRTVNHNADVANRNARLVDQRDGVR